VKHLKLIYVRKPNPSDDGFGAVRDLFARSDTTLTTISLWECNFDTAQNQSQLLAAFHTNRTVTDLALRQDHHDRL
jgi:hypothetical protein